MNLLVLTYHYFHRDKPAGIKTEDFQFSVRLDDFAGQASEIATSGYAMVDPVKIAAHFELSRIDHGAQIGVGHVTDV